MISFRAVKSLKIRRKELEFKVEDPVRWGYSDTNRWLLGSGNFSHPYFHCMSQDTDRLQYWLARLNFVIFVHGQKIKGFGFYSCKF